MKNPLLKTLLSAISLIVISSFFTLGANAQVVTVPALELKGLGPFNGKYLSVYYGIGNRAAIATEDDQITLREVKVKKTFQIVGNSIVAPRVELSRSGFFMAYNIIVFVVHSEPGFSWKNVNGTVPGGEVSGVSSQMLATDSLTKDELTSIRINDIEPVTIEFGTHIDLIRK